MRGADITVLVLSVLAIAGLGWYFFAPRKGRIADLGDGVQKIAVTVKAATARTISVHAKASRWRSNSTGRVRRMSTGWCSLTLASAPVSPRTPRPQCGYARPGRHVRICLRHEHGPRHPGCRPR